MTCCETTLWIKLLIKAILVITVVWLYVTTTCHTMSPSSFPGRRSHLYAQGFRRHDCKMPNARMYSQLSFECTIATCRFGGSPVEEPQRLWNTHSRHRHQAETFIRTATLQHDYYFNNSGPVGAWWTANRVRPEHSQAGGCAAPRRDEGGRRVLALIKKDFHLVRECYPYCLMADL